VLPAIAAAGLLVLLACEHEAQQDDGPGGPAPEQPERIDPAPQPLQLPPLVREATERLEQARRDATPAARQELIAFLESAVAQEPDDATLHQMLGDTLIDTHVFSLGDGDASPPPQRAREVLQRAIDLDPQHEVSYLVLARYYELSGEHAAGLRSLQALLERDPGNLDARVAEARCHLNLQQYERAATILRAVAVDARQRGDTHSWVDALDSLAEVHAAQGELDQLQAVIQRLEAAAAAGEISPATGSAACVYFALGEMYAATGTTDISAENFVLAADTEPTHPGRHHEAAQRLAVAGQLDKALLYAHRALRLGGEEAYGEHYEQLLQRARQAGTYDAAAVGQDPELAFRRALAAFDAGDIDQAELYAEWALTTGDPRAAVLQGFVYLLRRRYEGAGHMFRDAEGSPAGGTGFQVGQGHLDIIQKDYASARRRMRSSAQATGRRPSAQPDEQAIDQGYDWLILRMAWLGMGWSHSNQGEHEMALEWYQRLRDAHPDDPLALLGTANSNSALGRLASASELLEHLLALDPDNQYALAELALVRYNQGQTAAAEELFQSALQQEAETYTCPYEGLGLVYLRQGREQEAEDAFRKAIEINPDIEYLKYNGLARIYIEAGRFDEAEELLQKSAANFPQAPEARELLRQLRARQE